MSAVSASSLCICDPDSNIDRHLLELFKESIVVTDPAECPAHCTHLLWGGPSGLALGLMGQEQRHATRVDFSDPALLYRLRTSGKRQGIGKAVGLDKASRQVRVIDATAGLGRDALVLAHLGCEVLLLERSPLIHALLADGLRRGAHSQANEVRDAVSRMTLVHADARDYLQGLAAGSAQYPDVITLDPMYPSRQKSAAVKKDIGILQQVVGTDEDVAQLLALARQVAGKRVVVKRPPAQAEIAGAAPSFVMEGKAAVFAVYVNSSFSSIP